METLRHNARTCHIRLYAASRSASHDLPFTCYAISGSAASRRSAAAIDPFVKTSYLRTGTARSQTARGLGVGPSERSM
jgi:hypothetical protein